MDSTAKRLSSIHWYKELKVLNNGGVFFALLHLQIILSKMVVFHFKNKKFPRFRVCPMIMWAKGAKTKMGVNASLYTKLYPPQSLLTPPHP